VGFTLPKDLKYDAIESDINNVVSAKMLAQYTQGTDTRFLSRSYMDNIANIAVLKFLRTPNPDLGPQARIIEKLSLLRFLLPEEIMTGNVPDYRVMTIGKIGDSIETANNWTEAGSRHLSYRDRLFVSVNRDLDHFNKENHDSGWRTQNVYQYKLESDVKNQLVFIHSELSPHYYSSARFRAAFFQRELRALRPRVRQQLPRHRPFHAVQGRQPFTPDPLHRRLLPHGARRRPRKAAGQGPRDRRG
jgi:hypothetical protein